MTSQNAEYPVRFEADYPDSPSRVLALLGVLGIPLLFIYSLKMVLLIPHIVVLIVLTIVNLIVVYIGYWVVLITGRYPDGMFNFVYGVMRWWARADSWIYGWSDRYPPFRLGEADYPVRLEIDRPEAPSRLLALFGVLLVIIKLILLVPHLIILAALSYAMLASVYIGYWAALITGRYPEGLFNLVTGFQRWEYRVEAWLFGLTDRYPPLSLS